MQAVGDEIVEVDGFSVSEKSLLTHILGSDTPDTFVSIMVPSVPLLVACRFDCGFSHTALPVSA